MTTRADVWLVSWNVWETTSSTSSVILWEQRTYFLSLLQKFGVKHMNSHNRDQGFYLRYLYFLPSHIFTPSCFKKCDYPPPQSEVHKLFLPVLQLQFRCVSLIYYTWEELRNTLRAVRFLLLLSFAVHCHPWVLLCWVQHKDPSAVICRPQSEMWLLLKARAIKSHIRTPWPFLECWLPMPGCAITSCNKGWYGPNWAFYTTLSCGTEDGKPDIFMWVI